VLARRGAADRGAVLAREAVTLADTTEWPNVRADALMDLADVLQVTGSRVDTVAVLKRASALYVQKGNIVSAARAQARLVELRTG
jgi:hypothetical protein